MREDDHRKVKRRERLERKAREKEGNTKKGRKEEIRRYRNLQEMEVKDKLDKLARTGWGGGGAEVSAWHTMLAQS